MTTDQTTDPPMPRTLADTHHAVASIRPAQNAPLADWLAYHQQSAAMYAEVAEIDRGHHHEALFLAEHARQQAQDMKARIASQRAIADKE